MNRETKKGDATAALRRARITAFGIFVVALFLLVGVILVSDGRRSGMVLLGTLINGTSSLLGLSGAVFGLSLVMVWSGRAYFVGCLERWSVKLLGTFGVVISVCGLAGCGGTDGGGILGQLLAEKMTTILSPFVAVSLFCFLLVGAFMLATNWLFYEEFGGLIKGQKEDVPETASDPSPQTSDTDNDEYPIFRLERQQARIDQQVTPGEEAQLTGLVGETQPAIPEEAPMTARPVEAEAVSQPAPPEKVMVSVSPAPTVDGASLPGRPFSIDNAEDSLTETPQDEQIPVPLANSLTGRPHTFEDDEQESWEAEEDDFKPGQKTLWDEADEVTEDVPQPEPEERLVSEPGEVEIPRPQVEPVSTELVSAETFSRAAILVIESGRASTTILQRKLKVGYSAANQIMEQLESHGLVGSYRGSLAREVLLNMEEWEALGVTERT